MTIGICEFHQETIETNLLSRPHHKHRLEYESNHRRLFPRQRDNNLCLEKMTHVIIIRKNLFTILISM